jgi:hypothetical protein
VGYLAFHPFLVGIKEHCGYGSRHVSVADVSVNDLFLFVLDSSQSVFVVCVCYCELLLLD